MLSKKTRGFLSRYTAGVALVLPMPGMAKMMSSSPPQPAPPSITRTITVVGEGRARVTPDVATATIGVEAFNKNLAQATQEANTKMKAIIDQLKALGVQEQDIQTASFNVSVERRFDEQGRPAEITGFRVSNQVQVKLRDIPRTGVILDRVISVGANDIQGVFFSIEDPRPVQARARAEAINDAEMKAAQFAQSAGVNVGRVLQINEPGVRPIPFMGVEARLAREPVPIEPGSLEFVEQVEMIFELQ